MSDQDVVYLALRDKDKEIARLEALLDEGAQVQRCEFCKKLHDIDNMEAAVDCDVCQDCAKELRAEGFAECPRHEGEARNSCPCSQITAVK